MAPQTRVDKVRASGSDSEDEIATSEGNQHLTPNAGHENMPPTRVVKPAMTKATKRKASVGSKPTGAKRKPAPKAGRPALKDRTNVQDGNETEHVDRFDDDRDKMDTDAPTIPKAKRAKISNASAPKAKTTTAGKGKVTQRPTEILQGIPETQPDLEDIEQSIELPTDIVDVSDRPVTKSVEKLVQKHRSASVQPLLPRPSARPGSVQPPAHCPPRRERSGSVSGTERERRGGDPELRRKLKDLENKYESLGLKYRSLQEIGESSVQSNFEKLKRASDQRAKDANELVAGLKKELSDLRKTSTFTLSETTKLQASLSSLTNSNEKLTSDNTSLKSQLQISQNEVKSLETKLAASRQASAVPSSEMKASSQNRSIIPNATEAQKEAKMKENLYSDLTGLIINRIKRKEGEDEYDCIQTGRNGTLHFHLLVANDASLANPKTPNGLSYEEAEFAYEPLLDDDRDRDLLELLPDYLTDEICFPRNHAQKFYTRVVESMTKKIVVEDVE